MRFVLFIAIVAFAIEATVSNDVDVNEALDKAQNEINLKLMDQMMAGAKSSQMYRNKFTAV